MTRPVSFSSIAQLKKPPSSYRGIQLFSTVRVTSTEECAGQVRKRVTSGSDAQLANISSASPIRNGRRTSRWVSSLCVPVLFMFIVPFVME